MTLSPPKTSKLYWLHRILGISAQSLIWTYLNKDTHEEEGRDDFDAVHIESVVRTLEELSGLELRCPPKA